MAKLDSNRATGNYHRSSARAINSHRNASQTHPAPHSATPGPATPRPAPRLIIKCDSITLSKTTMGQASRDLSLHPRHATPLPAPPHHPPSRVESRTSLLAGDTDRCHVIRVKINGTLGQKTVVPVPRGLPAGCFGPRARTDPVRAKLPTYFTDRFFAFLPSFNPGKGGREVKDRETERHREREREQLAGQRPGDLM